MAAATHEELIVRAQRWVRAQRYPIVLADVHTNTTSEQPDVIGFRTYSDTLIVECKTSRADFRRDARKYARRIASLGMGYWRWFFTTDGIIDPATVTGGWGLAVVVGRRVKIIVPAKPFFERNLVEEHRLLVTALRRATEGWGRRMFGDIAPAAVDGDPHPTATKTIRKLRQEVTRLRDEVSRMRREENARLAAPAPPGLITGCSCAAVHCHLVPESTSDRLA